MLEHPVIRLVTSLLLLNLATLRLLNAQPPADNPKQGAALLKTDILAVFAHPDDETGVAATLAAYALGRNAVVANVYCTRGEGGGNMVGTQSGAALGHLREAELRDCLAVLGVRYCYFLDQLDWAYTESVSATLQKWGKEETLGRLVRLVRALRPEVIVTMNPAPTPGQHGHHQAAGVLATEAFAAAADQRRFPEQLTKDGLAVWQPRKLYFGGSNATVVATIQVNQSLPNGRTPGQLAAQALAHHRSQGFGNFSNAPWLQRPQNFTLVKSFTPVAEDETDLLRGLSAANLASSPTAFAPPPPRPPVALEFVSRPAITGYRAWVKVQGVEHLAGQFRADLPLVAGEPNDVRLDLRDDGATPVEGDVKLTVPSGWTVEPSHRRVHVTTGKSLPVPFRVTPPVDARADAELAANFAVGDKLIEVTARAHPVPRATVRRLKQAPKLDGSSAGWGRVPALVIAPTNLVQGKVADATDSSAVFRIAHDGRTFFVDVEVKDDVVVTNIAPDDIKGHWRSDSVEICINPVGSAEHTMGCFKLGIFPFDTTGVVRAARDADARQGPVEETAPGTRIISRRTADGYRIQAAIPFREIGISSPKGARLGFNLILYDGDKREAALGENINKSRLAWAPRSGVMGRPEDWGRIDLE